MADLLTQLNTALAGHYRLDRELGRGGMATVYLAHDLKHDRQVALKVLHPELAASLGPERFLREIHTTARLQHPHILPVFDSGETSGRLWYTMPYVEGESLRDKLRREIQLPVDEAIRIVREVALALDYAHRNGVVHRDVKPENILLADGQALVADFGVARALEEGTEGKLTGTGLTVGTVAYMSPEQASDGQLDGRSDIYALGCVLYELLAGEIPFAGRTPQAIIAKRVLEPIPQVRTLREGVPPDVEKTLTRALAKVPADRFATAREFADALARSDLHEYAGPASRVFSRPPVGRALGLWAAATAAVGVTAWSATEVIGLPDWVLPGSLGVMLAGLPVIGITAFVQRAAYRAYAVTPQRASGSAVPAQGTLATLALKASPHVSWRRTWIGGGAAVGAFAVLVVGFMVTRAFGIGPAASLRGKGAFGAQETVIVADFRSPAGDPALGPTVAEALRTDLAQSSSLKILTRASVREILGLMQRPAESVVPFELAREIATREGAKAVLDGEIVQLGQSYVVSARLVAALDGQELATFRETAANEDALIGAMGDLSRAVREKAGESLRAIRASSELERVTTPSLPALRKYVEGSVLADEAGEGDRGLALLDEAVTLDTAFAMAWRKIAVLLGNENRDRTRALAAIATAYRHRERLTEQERLLTEGYYYTRGPRPDRDRALMAYEEAIRMDSTSVSALNNAAVVYGEKREYERAELLYRKVIALPRTFGGAFTNLMTTQIANGRLAALDSTAAAFRARFPDSRDLWEGDWFAAWGHGQFDRADSIGRAVFAQSRTARQAIRAAQATMAMAYLHGRLQEGLRWATLRSEAEVRVTPSAASRLVLALDTAGYAVLRGDASNGRAAIQRGLTRHPTDSLPPDERPWETLAELAGALGDAPLAHLALTGYERDLASTAKDPVGSLAFFSAHVALAERRWDEAVGMLHEAYSRFAVDRRYAMSQLGRAHDLAGRSDSAIVYYEKFLGTPDASPVEDSRSRGQIYRRLGELHEAAGSNRQAMEHYGRFVELWAEADPFLQPQVAEVRKRLEHLRAQVG